MESLNERIQGLKLYKNLTDEDISLIKESIGHPEQNRVKVEVYDATRDFLTEPELLKEIGYSTKSSQGKKIIKAFKEELKRGDKINPLALVEHGNKTIIHRTAFLYFLKYRSLLEDSNRRRDVKAFNINMYKDLYLNF